MDTGLSTSLQVQAVTSVGPGNFSEPMTVVVTPSSDSSSNPTLTVIVVVVVIVVFIIVLCSVVAGLLAYIFWWAAQHEACMHAQCSFPIYVATRAFVCVCMHTQMQ